MALTRIYDLRRASEENRVLFIVTSMYTFHVYFTCMFYQAKEQMGILLYIESRGYFFLFLISETYGIPEFCKINSSLTS